MKPIIAGPCSAESEQQILQTAEFLAKETAVKTMRAGVWKPRSRPGGFEGHGQQALRWLQTAKQTYGLSIAVEVAVPEHIEQCLKYDIDTVWIGARTTGNPFSVQDIAQSLKGTNLSVMVKNPLNPDIGLWLGAIERIEKVGISQPKAIHRGFSTYQTSKFRNPPMWEIPIEIKRLRPDIQLYCDPSHIAGQSNLVPHIAQKAFDMDMDGLMIELHPTPKHALTDAFQQLDFANFKNLLQHLIEKNAHVEHPELAQMRTLIDDLDEELITILAKRMAIVNQIGAYKHNHQLTILQMDRWKSLLQNRLKTSQKQNLNDEFMLNLWRLIHAEALRIQES
ncbi:MAG: bifunctional 3-deoxy-7-phosphoheptulonate synthase/chorismate mutase type II [Bacteroidales bacterium]|jgi:chorismate mutase|nr:bifunctional 3-deoxy-7-phosphoheptulonate synthase/chorismate mutase type II [Bacteroidales bacterium]